MNQEATFIDMKDNKYDFSTEVLQCKIPVIVDFYADWCGPCHKFFPKIQAYYEESHCFKLVKLNVDIFEEIAEKYEISSIPAIYLFKGGKVVMSFVGSNEEKLREMIENAKK